MTLLDVRRIALPTVDRRTLVGVVLAATAAILVLILTRPPASTPVLVAEEPIPAGVPLSEAAVGFRMVTQTDGLVVGDSVGELADWTVAVTVAEGEPLTPSLLRAPTSSPATHEMAISLPAGQAVLGRIAIGDTIDVYATYSEPGEPSRTELIASGIHVISANAVDPGESRASVDLVVAVDSETAGVLAGAMHTAELDLVRRPQP